MGSESKNRNGDGGGGGGVVAQAIPAAAKKVVQSLKEIVNCTEQEIYAVLKECDMDPNRAVERLLAQDTFHEVRSKRERRKEMKEALDSRSRGNNVGLIRGGKTGSERNVMQSGSAHMTYKDLGNSADKGEVGSICSSVTSSTITTHVIGKNTNSDAFSTDNGRRPLGAGDSISASGHVSAGRQPSWLRVSKGHLSMADIVRIGRPSQDAVSFYHSNTSAVSASGKSESSLSLHCDNHSEQQDFHDEWPVIEQPFPVGGNSQALNTSASSSANGPSEHPSLNSTAVSLLGNCELDESQVSWGDAANDNVISEKNESASMSSKHTTMSNTGLGSHYNYNLKDTGSSDFHSSYEHHEDVSSAASDFQRLSIRNCELEVPSSEDKRTVVLPNHLQALAAECSHLSFGTYNGGSNSAPSAMHLSDPSRSGLEEKAAAVHSSSAQFLDGSSLYGSDKQLCPDVLKGTSVDKNYDFTSSPQQELVKHIVPEATLGHEYNSMASVSDPSFQKSQWLAPSLHFNSTGLQDGNLSTFPREMHADSNSIPGDVLAFLMSQSQPARYSNAVSSISNPAISISEVTKPGVFALPHRYALPRDLTVQSSVHFEQLADAKGYQSLPQNQSYMAAINTHQAFSGGTAYNQSPAEIKYNLSQRKNEYLMSRLPPAKDAFGYGNLGSSSYNPGSFLSNPSFGHVMPSRNFNDILPSQYNGGHNVNSIQQHGGLSPWNYGTESRSSFVPENSHYNLLGQPSQVPPSQHLSPGYSDFYHSQTRVVEEVQRPGGFPDSSKQLHQFWQHSH